MIEAIVFNGIEYRRFDDRFFVSKCGLLLRDMKPKEPRTMKGGYLAISRNLLVHRMIASAWIRLPNKGEHVHHKDHNRANNHADNLEWVTPKIHLTELHPERGEIIGRYVRTDVTRQKLRNYRLGRKMPEETKAKIRESMKRNGWHPPAPKGRLRPLSEYAWMFEKHHKWVACIVHGVRYKSFTDAGKALGIRSLTLRKRCLSTNFPEYQLESIL